MILPLAQSATLVQDLLRRSSERVAHKVALISGERRLTYGEIVAAADRLAGALRRQGVRRGSRVVIDLADGPELVISIFGVLQAGGVFVVVSHAIRRPKLAAILDNCQASVLIISAEQLAWAESLVADVATLKTVIVAPRHPPQPDPVLCLSFEAIQDQFAEYRTAPGNIDRDLACLAYTCLANGDPRGAMFDHDSIVFAANSLVQCLGCTGNDIVLVAAPIPEGGSYDLLAALSVGATVVLGAGLSDPAALLQTAVRESVTLLAGTPAVLAGLPTIDLRNYDLSPLRHIVVTADTYSPGLVSPLQRALPGVRTLLLQSFPEAQIALHLECDALDRRPGCAGLPIPGTEAWIEDARGKILEAGQVGTLVIRGRHTMRGFWGDPIATAAQCRPGRLPGEQVCYTRDLYRMDGEGYLYFVAHGDSAICSSGHRVVPAEIEDVLYRLPGVTEAAVIGVPEPPKGVILKAFVATSSATLTSGDILAHCRAHLEPHLVPQCVEIRAELPRTLAGAVLRSALV